MGMGFGPLAVGAGAQAGLQELLRQRILERQMALQEQAQRENSDYRNRELDLRHQERADALAEASYWKQDARDQRQQGLDRQAGENLVQTKPVGGAIDEGEANLLQRTGNAGVIRAIPMAGTTIDGGTPPPIRFRGFTPQESQQREMQASAASERASAREDSQRQQEHMAEVLAGLRTDSARQRIIAVPAVNERGESVTQGTDLESGEVLWEKPRDITAAQKDRKASMGRIAPVLNGISELSEKINTGKGALAKVAGGAARAAAQANYNDDVAEYEAMISGFTPMVARAVGHSGVLTEQDVQSVRALFPKPGDSKTLRDRKIARIQTILGASGEMPEAAPTTKTPQSDPLGIR